MNKKYHLHKMTPSRLREVAVLPITQKQIQRVKKNEETEIHVPNKRIRLNLRKKTLII